MTRDEVKAVLARSEKPLSPNAPHATPFGIPLRRILWKGATTFGQSRSSSAIRTWKPRWCMPMFWTGEARASRVPRTTC